ncbi:MAG: substrate-binding domain-containing protein [Burkholderiales bacterium]
METTQTSRSRATGLALLASIGFVWMSLSGVAAAAELVIPGSGNPEYVLGALAKAFNARQKETTVMVPPSVGTAGAIRDVTEGKALLARVGRALKDDERAKGLSFIPLGRDAVVFVVGAGVSARSVTGAQMIEVYSGKISDWRQIGAKPGPIRAIGREPSDASRQALAVYINTFRDMSFSANVKMVHLDPQLIELLDRFNTSLGVLNRSALYAAKTKVIPLAIDKIEPSQENLISGRYPMWLELGLIHRTGATLGSQAQAFLDFIASPDGTRILRDHGLVQPAAKS